MGEMTRHGLMISREYVDTFCPEGIKPDKDRTRAGGWECC
jgi:hypothetical protein